MKSFLLIAVLFAFQGIHGRDPLCLRNEEGHKCAALVPVEQMRIVMNTTGPDAEALKILCPSALKALKCMKQFAEICIPNNYHEKLGGLLSVAAELCDESSALHMAYVKNFDCVYGLVPEIRPCVEESQLEVDLYEKFREEEVEDIDEVWEEKSCLQDYLVVDCVGSKIRETCGADALSTGLEIVTVSKHLCPLKEMVDINEKYQLMLSLNASSKARNPLSLFQDKTGDNCTRRKCKIVLWPNFVSRKFNGQKLICSCEKT